MKPAHIFLLTQSASFLHRAFTTSRCKIPKQTEYECGICTICLCQLAFSPLGHVAFDHRPQTGRTLPGGGATTVISTSRQPPMVDECWVWPLLCTFNINVDEVEGVALRRAVRRLAGWTGSLGHRHQFKCPRIRLHKLLEAGNVYGFPAEPLPRGFAITMARCLMLRVQKSLDGTPHRAQVIRTRSLRSNSSIVSTLPLRLY